MLAVLEGVALAALLAATETLHLHRLAKEITAAAAVSLARTMAAVEAEAHPLLGHLELLLLAATEAQERRLQYREHP
jgi:hypothetical protein